MKNDEIIFRTTKKALLGEAIFTGVILTVIFYMLFSYDALIPMIEVINEVGILTVTMIMCPALILVSVVLVYGNMLIKGEFGETKEKPIKKIIKKKTKTTKKTK